MEVSTQKPILYVSVSKEWPGTSLLVLGVKSPSSGEATPTNHSLATITATSKQPQPLTLQVKNGGFEYVALSFAVTATPTSVGKITVTIRRDEDPLEPGGTRPVYKTIELERADQGSPMFVIRTFTLVAK